MKAWVSREALSAVLILGVGLFACLYAIGSYNLGSLSAPGSGLFPAIVGGLMALTGAIIGLRAVVARATEDGPRFEGRALAAILAAVAIFAAMVETTGYAPAVFVLGVVASLAERGMPWRTRLILAAAMTVIAVVVFTLVLRVSLTVIEGVW